MYIYDHVDAHFITYYLKRSQCYEYKKHFNASCIDSKQKDDLFLLKRIISKKILLHFLL